MLAYGRKGSDFRNMEKTSSKIGREGSKTAVLAVAEMAEYRFM